MAKLPPPEVVEVAELEALQEVITAAKAKAQPPVLQPQEPPKEKATAKESTGKEHQDILARAAQARKWVEGLEADLQAALAKQEELEKELQS